MFSFLCSDKIKHQILVAPAQPRTANHFRKGTLTKWKMTTAASFTKREKASFMSAEQENSTRNLFTPSYSLLRNLCVCVRHLACAYDLLLLVQFIQPLCYLQFQSYFFFVIIAGWDKKVSSLQCKRTAATETTTSLQAFLSFATGW